MAKVNISLYSSITSEPEIFSLNNIDLNENVAELKGIISERCNLEKKKFDCVHHGNVLKENEQLQFFGIQSGSIIHCILKNEPKIHSVTPLNLVEMQQLLVSLRSAISNSGFRCYIKKLRAVDHLHSRLLTEYPPIANDPAAIAFLQDSDFIVALQNVDILTRVVEERPNIGRALQIICKNINSEVISPRRSHHVSYSMDALSDDEMETEQNETTRSTRNSDFQAITPAQLAAALANATGGSSWRGASSSTPLTGLTPPSSALTPLNTPAPPSGGSGAATGGGGTSPGGPITNEMFSQALQNALAASASRSSGSGSSAQPAAPPIPSVQLQNVEESLQLMREMGITDQNMSLQALQATDGDVQAAVNLIFAQWMADD